jgi:hypothetical protein
VSKPVTCSRCKNPIYPRLGEPIYEMESCYRQVCPICYAIILSEHAAASGSSSVTSTIVMKKGTDKSLS